MNEYDKKEVEDFLKQGDKILSSADIIICTEKGIIAFIDQKTNKCYQMQFGGSVGEGFTVMQYCTENTNKWTSKIIWMSDLYFKTLNY